MADPLSTAASAVTILDRIAAVGKWIWGRVTGDHRSPVPRLAGRFPHNGFEILPISFHITLNSQVPNVEAAFYAVNYTRWHLLLRDATVQTLNVGGLSIENIPLRGEVDLPPKASHPIYFRKTLVDGEARSASATAKYGSLSGAFSLVARAQHGRKELKYGPVASMVISGKITGVFPETGAA